MKKTSRLWTREETIAALNLYYKIPFSKTVKTNSKIIDLANLIKRTPSSVAMKLGNFGNFDSELKKQNISGLSHASKLDEEIWYEYYNKWEKLAYDSEKIIADFYKVPIEKTINIDIEKLPQGKEREVIVKQRVGQSFFRQTILGLYDFKCCVSGLSQSCFLEASHISNWANDKQNRLNPSNGICLNIILHKAFDNYFISITPDYELVVNTDKLVSQNDLEHNSINHLFLIHNHKKINLPDKFKPSKCFLEEHYHNFRKQ